MFDTLHYLLHNIFIIFGSELYRQIVGITIESVAGCFCYPPTKSEGYSFGVVRPSVLMNRHLLAA